ncbi:amidohydrolase family protein [Nocardioides sp. SR21]|uniref:N-acyl-D-amino-acid deacylase family protein n=1 Tax=Nocardioides sp. SR21 TaxID=2919501 RepID=UPI001FAA5203|nr:amidohydrolase family protein [Nocardioides sp. SR21]
MATTLVITGGTVYDGSGSEGVRADVAVEGDRVVQVAPPGQLPDTPGARRIDATGLAVAPGFVNVLSHAWGSLQQDGAGTSDLLQGVTTQVFGEAFSLGPGNDDVREMVGALAGGHEEGGVRLVFDHLADGLDHLERRGVAQNVASFVGGHNLRVLGARFDDRPLSAHELDRLVGLMREEMQDGALGIGTALIYPPGNYASTDELIAVCGPVGEYGGTYISHMRSEGDEFLECLDELLLIGERAGCRAEVYHLKAAGRRNWPKMALAIERIQAARDAGREVGANMYPYTAGGTALAACIPPRFHDGGPDALARRLADPVVRREIAAAMSTESGGGFENLFLAASEGEGILFFSDLSDGTPARGRHLSDLAGELGLSPADTLLEIVARDAETGVAYFLMDEANVELGLAQPWVSLGSDAEAYAAVAPHTDEPTHPRTYGTFARFLGHYVRERGVTDFADAVRRLTSLPCDGLGLRDRGRLAPGAYADVVVLDPSTVIDHATYDDPHRYSTGVHHVVVNGEPVVEAGAVLEARPGIRLRRGA